MSRIETEKGTASIKIELKDGAITVRHGTDDDVLFTTPAPEGSWDHIWKELNSIKGSYDSQKRVSDHIEKYGVKETAKMMKNNEMI